jgi:gluconolactonase
MKGTVLSFFWSTVLLLVLSCSSEKKEEEALDIVLPLEIEKLQPALEGIISMDAAAEVLGLGFEWTEGPLWLEATSQLLFSEIPANKVHSWSEENGVELYLEPAGYTAEESRGGELGSNGLILDPDGNLVLCQHGDRRMARMNAPLSNPEPEFETIVGTYEGMPFNSPNDAVYDSEGNLYFTDPPYGLEHNIDDPKKEIPFQGVYRYSKEGDLDLLLDSITRPNGLAFLPGEEQLIIANSDPEKPQWYIYEVTAVGKLENGKLFCDGSEVLKSEKGLPDGLKINSKGTIFATGPGGIWVFQPNGVLLGRLKMGELTSNVALNKEENILFVTADSYVVKIPLL